MSCSSYILKCTVNTIPSDHFLNVFFFLVKQIFCVCFILGYPSGVSQLQSQNSQHPSPSSVFPAGASGASVTPASRGTMYPQPSVAVSQQSSGPQSLQFPLQCSYQAKGQQQPKYPLQSQVYRQQVILLFLFIFYYSKLFS